MTPPESAVVRGQTRLDADTLRWCAEHARQAAAGMPKPRAHQQVAAAALVALAEVFDALLAEAGAAA